MARLATTVIVTKEFTGEPVVFYAGDEPEKWAADQITNPKAWAPDEEPTPEGGDESGSNENPGGTSEEAPSEPPRDGTGSGVQAWRKYATAIGVEFEKDAKRDEIVALVDAAKAEAELEEPSREDADLDEWRAYAEAKGFDVPLSSTVEEIIAAVDADADES